MPAACITSGWTILQPPPSRSSRYSQRTAGRSPLAIAPASPCRRRTWPWHSRRGSAPRPPRSVGAKARAAATALRGRVSRRTQRRSPPLAPPPRARRHQLRRMGDGPRLVLAQPFPVERPPLETSEAAPDRLARGGLRLFRRVRPRQPVAGIAPQPLAKGPAQQAIDRCPEPLPLQVPEGDVDGPHGREERGAASPAPGVIHRLPVPLRTRRVFADQHGHEFPNGRFHRLDGSVERALTPAVKTLVGRHLDEQPVAPLDPALESLDLRDLHRLSSIAVLTGEPSDLRLSDVVAAAAERSANRPSMQRSESHQSHTLVAN